jgi:hypothetical protein
LGLEGCESAAGHGSTHLSSTPVLGFSFEGYVDVGSIKKPQAERHENAGLFDGTPSAQAIRR